MRSCGAEADLPGPPPGLPNKGCRMSPLLRDKLLWATRIIAALSSALTGGQRGRVLVYADPGARGGAYAASLAALELECAKTSRVPSIFSCVSL
jgi:hypothetical protein